MYIFWHAFLQATREVLIDPVQEIPEDVQEQVTAILNSRHRQVFVDGNLSSSANVYLTATYLNPSLSHTFYLMVLY